jgi:predicted GIY-YIG superfamily endonuclease
MWIPEPLPEEPEYVYVIHDGNNGLYKIGHTGNLESRRRGLRKGHFREKVKLYHSWFCDEYFTALYVEQILIKLLRNYGYKEVRTNNWFEIDQSEIDIAICLIGELIRRVADWELNNLYADLSVPRIIPPLLITGRMG